MTIADRNNKLKHFIACLKCDVSGKSCDVNCSTQYDAGNMGEIIENLEEIAKALEQEPRWIPISERFPEEHYVENSYNDPSDCVLVQLDSGLMEVSRYWKHMNDKYNRNPWIDLDEYQTVVAWQPLPKPYEESEGNNE